MTEKLNSQQFDKSLLKSCGVNTFISANIEIRRPQLVSVGNRCAIDSGFYCTTEAEIKDHIHIAAYITVIGGAKSKLFMDHFSAMAAGCRIICASDQHLGEGLNGANIPEEFRDHVTYGNVIFEKFSITTTNVVVMPGVTLAEGSVVAPFSLVTKSTEPWTVNIGTPARAIKTRPKDKILEFAKRLGYL